MDERDARSDNPTESADLTAALDGSRQIEARAYARLQRRLMVIEMALSGVLVIAFLVTGASQWLEDALVGLGITSQWVLVPVYVAIASLAFGLILLPLNWRQSFVLPHRFGLSTQTRRGWWSDELKSALLAAALGLPLAELIYWLLRTYPQTWWLWAAAVMIAISVVLGSLFPILILPIFYKLTPLDDAGLAARVQRLAERARVRIVGVYTINLSSRTTAANAMVMGLGRSKRIALGDTLYADFSHDEIETILAHELGHDVHHDLELGIIVQSLFLLGGMALAQVFLTWGVARFGFDGPGDIAALPLLLLALALFGLVTLPLSNGYSRWRERLADRYAVEVTGNRAAFASAMTRLANQNLAEADPPRWEVWLLYSHPPIKERIAQA